MMRLRASLCVLLLACIPAAWADSVNVTTVVDEDNVANGGTDTGCSLREALAFMERSAQDRLNGYGGCKASTTAAGADTIVLPAANKLNSGVLAYQLTLGEIVVRASVTIDGTPSTLLNSAGQVIGNDASLATRQDNFPEIRAAAGSRIFRVTHYPPQAAGSSPSAVNPPTSAASPSTLTLTDARLTGCGSDCSVNGVGGIIEADDGLTLTSVLLKNGSATGAGGAIYLGPAGALTVTGSDFEGNSAANGAAIDVAPNTQSVLNVINVSSSLFTNNTATANGGAIVELQASQVNTSTLNTSTISGNTGTGLRARPGLGLKNDTIVNNSGGVDWQFADLSTGNMSMYNTIVAGNPNALVPSTTASKDCLGLPTTPWTNLSTFSYNVFGLTQSCVDQFKDKNNFTSQITTNQTTDLQPIIASSCPAPGTPGLLCPLPATTDFNRVLVPRLPVALVSGETAAQLPVDEALNLLVNRGSPATTGSDVCASSDERGNAQRTNSCDIGAAALKAPSSIKLSFTSPLSTTSSNEFVTALGDVELLPQDACAQVNIKAAYSDGCFLQGAVATPKGSFTIDRATHQLVYTPGTAFYGTDTFSFLVATTLSRFSDTGADPRTGQFVQVNVIIQTEPLGSEHSSEVGIGAISGLELLGLGGLFAVRARRQRRA